jgi:hypothetical protein
MIGLDYNEGPGQSLKVDGKKVQQLIDDHVRALDIEELMDQRDVTYKRFLDYPAKFKTEGARRPNPTTTRLLYIQTIY